MSFNNVAVVYVKANAYTINFWYRCKDDVINIMSGSNLTRIRSFLSIFFLCPKNEWECWFNLLSKKQRRDTK